MPTNPLASLRGRIGALALHAAGLTNTEPARRAFFDRFETDVDPERVLSPGERARRAALARRLYFTRLALASAKARAKRAGRPEHPTASESTSAAPGQSPEAAQTAGGQCNGRAAD